MFVDHYLTLKAIQDTTVCSPTINIGGTFYGNIFQGEIPFSYGRGNGEITVDYHILQGYSGNTYNCISINSLRTGSRAVGSSLAEYLLYQASAHYHHCFSSGNIVPGLKGSIRIAGHIPCCNYCSHRTPAPARDAGGITKTIHFGQAGIIVQIKYSANDHCHFLTTDLVVGPHGVILISSNIAGCPGLLDLGSEPIPGFDVSV
jgi:hypothetical protein